MNIQAVKVAKTAIPMHIGVTLISVICKIYFISLRGSL